MDVGRRVAVDERLPSPRLMRTPLPPQVSLLTATRLDPVRAPFLASLHTDLESCSVDWEWIIVVDGEHHRSVSGPISTDPRVRILRSGRAIGAAAARNLGLGVARGAYIATVDDDDRLPPGSLELRLSAAAEHQVAWVGGLLADLRVMTLHQWDCPMPRGRAAAGDVWRTWGCPCLPFPIGPTTLLVEAGLLRRVGGWQGLPQAEDFGMALAVTGRAPGVMLDRVVYLYRKHEAQMTSQPGFDELEALVRHITFERGRLSVAGPPPEAVPCASAHHHQRSMLGQQGPRVRAVAESEHMMAVGSGRS